MGETGFESADLKESILDYPGRPDVVTEMAEKPRERAVHWLSGPLPAMKKATRPRAEGYPKPREAAKAKKADSPLRTSGKELSPV